MYMEQTATAVGQRPCAPRQRLPCRSGSAAVSGSVQPCGEPAARRRCGSRAASELRQQRRGVLRTGVPSGGRPGESGVCRRASWRPFTVAASAPAPGPLGGSGGGGAGRSEPGVRPPAAATLEAPLVTPTPPPTRSPQPPQQPQLLADPLPEHPLLRRGTLPNGLRYCLLPNGVPSARFEAHLEMHVGSVDEREDEQGLAHLVEHVTFLGSPKRDRLLGAPTITHPLLPCLCSLTTTATNSDATSVPFSACVLRHGDAE